MSSDVERVQLTAEEAVKALDTIGQPGSNQDHGNYIDPEESHRAADDILYLSVPPEVRDAYDRVVERAGAWWYA